MFGVVFSIGICGFNCGGGNISIYYIHTCAKWYVGACGKVKRAESCEMDCRNVFYAPCCTLEEAPCWQILAQQRAFHCNSKLRSLLYVGVYIECACV